jgi:citronellyl-CoA synthetase
MRISEVAATLAEVPPMLGLARELKPRPMSTRDCFGARVETTASKYPEETAVIFEGEQLTWRELNEYANRYVGAFRGMGLKKGDTVSVLLENRIQYLATLIALNKMGATAALINTNLTGAPLVHCISITDSNMCLFGEERLDAIADVRDDPALASVSQYLFVPDTGETACPGWAADMAEESADEDYGNPPETAGVTLGDIALYIFTSGTTGLPKAAIMSNRRLLTSSAVSYKVGLRCDVSDCIYLCLPIYHGTGLFLGVIAAFSTGASMFIRRRFSASNFLSEVREHNTTCFIYIGELCRYLLNTPRQPDDANNPMVTMMGNGLRPDVWHEFKERFGINRVSEFYGSSEGNVGFVNLLNKDCTVGATTLPVALVKYDIDADEIVRDSKGHCIKVTAGQPGLLLGKITPLTAFEGYTNKEATERKILHNAFRRGDSWFNTGDLMKTVDVGFAMGMQHYQFVDRVGDTFRWKSENVSTNEVGEIINGHPQIAFCNVYGVEIPKADGRAGMAALALAEKVNKLDLASFSEHVNAQLPPYARPVFLRIQRELDTTGTFKLLKGELRKQAYDLQEVEDDLYVMKPGSKQYEPLDEAFAAKLRAGEGGY